MNITVGNAVQANNDYEKTISANNEKNISINIDPSTTLTEKFINFEVTETFDPPKLVQVYNDDEFADDGFDYEEVYRAKTLYKANKFELYLTGYFSDKGNGKFEGWSTDFGFEEISLNNSYHKYLLKKFGIKYTKELNEYALTKLKGLPSKYRGYWQKIYKITNEKIKNYNKSKKQNSIEM